MHVLKKICYSDVCSSQRLLKLQKNMLATNPASDLTGTKINADSSEDSSKKKSITWLHVTIGITGCASIVGYMYYLKKQKAALREAERQRQLGKTLIGGPWELLNHDGKLVKSEDYIGKWTLIYFGFTHCPDICPDEIEKMVNVLTKLEDDKKKTIDIAGLFFTVDPERDTPERVKKYILEFSPKLMGFTGNKEQVDKVCKTFRVYQSQGPRDQFSDYIVDHTIIIYLVDPDGNFVDYFGQRTSVNEMVTAIQLLESKRQIRKKKEAGQLSIFDRISLGSFGSSS